MKPMVECPTAPLISALSPHSMRGEGGFSRVRGVPAHDVDRKLLLAATLVAARTPRSLQAGCLRYESQSFQRQQRVHRFYFGNFRRDQSRVAARRHDRQPSHFEFTLQFRNQFAHQTAVTVHCPDELACSELLPTADLTSRILIRGSNAVFS